MTLKSVYTFYRDGFKNMTIGKKLWILIIVKLIFIFLIMKLLFFPDLLSRDYDDDDSRAGAVRTTLINRGAGDELNTSD